MGLTVGSHSTTRSGRTAPASVPEGMPPPETLELISWAARRAACCLGMLDPASDPVVLKIVPIRMELSFR